MQKACIFNYLMQSLTLAELGSIDSQLGAEKMSLQRNMSRNTVVGTL